MFLIYLNIFTFNYIYCICKMLSYIVLLNDTERKIIMLNEVYAIYDDASECFVQFINCQNEKIAKMTFEKLFKEKRLQIPMLYDYPNTYTVYKIASFDDNSGIFENNTPHTQLLNFGSLLDA